MAGLTGKLTLAPMAGATDAAFRTLCSGMGASATVTEMVSAKALCFGDRKSRELLAIEDSHRPCSAQIFGSDPDIMAKGAAIALSVSGADAIDINMGCPVAKIVKNGEGSALMKSPELAAEIVRAVCSSVKVPVTVKFRKGFSENTAKAFGEAMEKAGAAAVCIHGRTRDEMYSGKADWGCIKEAVSSLSVPVFGSGDLMSREACGVMLDSTGCAGAAVARGALGNPFIFREGPAPTAEEMIFAAKAHIEGMCARKGEARGCSEGRKQLLWYLARFKKAAPYKREGAMIKSLGDLYALISKMQSEGAELKPWTSL